jgi:hypothetical protein
VGGGVGFSHSGYENTLEFLKKVARQHQNAKEEKNEHELVPLGDTGGIEYAVCRIIPSLARRLFNDAAKLE